MVKIMHIIWDTDAFIKSRKGPRAGKGPKWKDWKVFRGSSHRHDRVVCCAVSIYLPFMNICMQINEMPFCVLLYAYLGVNNKNKSIK